MSTQNPLNWPRRLLWNYCIWWTFVTEYFWYHASLRRKIKNATLIRKTSPSDQLAHYELSQHQQMNVNANNLIPIAFIKYELYTFVVVFCFLFFSFFAKKQTIITVKFSPPNNTSLLFNLDLHLHRTTIICVHLYHAITKLCYVASVNTVAPKNTLYHKRWMK